MDSGLNRPKIGLAFSGAAVRAVFYIGFLEVLDEHNIAVDHIAACSSGTIVAAAYACGSLQKLKQRALALDRKYFFNLLPKPKISGGLYNLDQIEDWLREVITGGAKLEDVRPRLSFVATDIARDEQVVLAMGDIAHSVRIACTVPGLFEPVQWGGRVLVDGGLFNFVPLDVLKEGGADISIGVNLRDDRHLLMAHKKAIHSTLKVIKKIFLLNYAGRMWNYIHSALEERELIDYYRGVGGFDHKPFKGMFTILGRSLDLAISRKQDRHLEVFDPATDILIRPIGPKLGWVDFNKAQELYEWGRQSAQENIPAIKRLIANFEAVRVEQKVSIDQKQEVGIKN